MTTTTETQRTDAVQCEDGMLSADRCKNPATLETNTGYKCCKHHAPLREGKYREDVKPMTTQETPRTDACPHCGCQTKDPFGMGKTIHNIENCKRNRELAEAKAEVERLKKPRYPFQTFRQFCEFLTSNNLIDEKAVSDPEGWDGGVELDRIEMAFDRAWKIIRLSQPDQP